MRHSLLIHTTDPDLYLTLRYILEQAGHNVLLAPTLDVALNAPRRDPSGNTILVCLSAEDMLRASKPIRQRRPDFRIIGFPLGSETIGGSHLVDVDYLVKRPFNPSELLMFLQFAAASNLKGQSLEALTLSDVEIDLAAVRVRRAGADIHLSPLHFRLLVFLAEHSDRVVTRNELIEKCWPAGAVVEPRTVDIHVGRIRQVLNQHGDNVIRTVRSIGYAAAKA